MKKLIFSLTLLIFSGLLVAQSAKYAEAMKSNLEKFGQAETGDALTVLSNSFERIGNAEKTQWLPYYYSAFALIRAGMVDAGADKDRLATQASELIAKAETINNNSEIAALKYMNATLKLLVNPMERWQTAGAEAELAYQQGIAMDAKNSKLYYLKGMSVLNTPTQFGGGFEKAKPYFEKAVANGENVHTEAFYPSWGAAEAQAELDKVK